MDELISIIAASFVIACSIAIASRPDFSICDGFVLSCIFCSVRDDRWTLLKDWLCGCEVRLDLVFVVLAEVAINVLGCSQLFGLDGFLYS